MAKRPIVNKVFELFFKQLFSSNIWNYWRSKKARHLQNSTSKIAKINKCDLIISFEYRTCANKGRCWCIRGVLVRSVMVWSFWKDNPAGSPCDDGIQIQLLHSVRFWTSLVRNCLNYPATLESKGCNGIMSIDLASLRSLSWQ